MAALPVVALPLDYDASLEQIKDFLQNAKPERRTRAAANGNVNDAAVNADGDDDFEEEEGYEEDAALDLYNLDIDGDDEGQDEERRRAARPSGYKYRDAMQRIANRDQSKLIIDLEDVKNMEDGQELVQNIIQNTRRYIDLFSEAVDQLLPAPSKDISYKSDVHDVIMAHRRERNQINEENESAVFPPELLRRYNLYFRPLRSSTPLAVREVKGAHLGKLITVRGIITRVSEVKPLLQVSAFSCDACGCEVFQEVDKKTVTPLTECVSDDCKQNNTRGKLHLQTRACKFTPFQEVKMQEMTDQVPVGHIPRSMTVHLYGGMTRSVNPGDVVHIGGIFIPTPYSAFKAMKAGMLTDTYLEAQSVRQLKKQYNTMALTPEIEEAITDLRNGSDVYNKLASSIAPEIFGHEDVKKALLLLLVGGVSKKMGDGMSIRGDLNICLMGDPGVAKSQLLKYIAKVAPRGVYTTGRGSSGVGLTAAVMRDPVTDEMVLEGGALVLADNGIACIDEFDKMDESDRTAIHEVMEQQTISISKAGITTTLNARTSILAAANPLYGRYNPKISPVDNINLPAALLSRFDILFLILDTPSKDDDERLAQHVTYVHMHNEHPPLQHDPIDPVLMRHYIAEARRKRPVVPREVSNYVVSAYVQLRKNSKEEEEKNSQFTYTSARTLLAVLRLSQALARLRFSDQVEIPDVDEALRLMEVSMSSLFDEDEKDREADRTDVSKIYRIIKDMASSGGSGRRPAVRTSRQSRSTKAKKAAAAKKLGKGPALQDDDREAEAGMSLDEDDDEPSEEEDDAETRTGFQAEQSMREIRERVFAKGFTEHQLNACIQEYEDLNVWQVEANGTVLRFVTGGEEDF
ncbi:MCM-domain-containing protein [Cystobasidium minutum MCA 4210]|uniref:DNA replication licensing factor MCM7 n=1 Tax=Cystobasidium minutum MCA 4210 TaxID=1397322 RepID=UPI0034CE4F23|eukprot:jgi/Rhomi1/212283/estExt_Genemark1.C_60177